MGVHVLNIGSVRKPKDGGWRAGYVLVKADEEIGGIEFVRVEYDLERAVEGIHRSELPDDFERAAWRVMVASLVSPERLNFVDECVLGTPPSLLSTGTHQEASGCGFPCLASGARTGHRIGRLA